MTRTLIIETHANSPEMYDGCATHASVKLTPEYCKLIRDRIAFTLEHPDVAEVHYRDYHVEFHDHCPVSEGILDEDGEDAHDTLDQGSVIVESGVVTPVNPPIRAELERMVISGEDVYWTFIPKHCSMTEAAGMIPLCVFEEPEPAVS